MELNDDNERLRDKCASLEKELDILKALVNSGNFVAPDGTMYKVNASQLVIDATPFARLK